MKDRRGILLDTQVLVRDFHLEHAAFAKLKAHLAQSPDCDLLISPVVILETVNRYRKTLAETSSDLEKALANMARLHEVPRAVRDAVPNVEQLTTSYKLELLERLKGFRARTVGLPGASHREVLERAINRQRPFDDKGRGYQDTLLWLTAVELLHSGEYGRIAFVSGNRRDFGQVEGGLFPALQDECDGRVDYFLDLATALDEVFPEGLPPGPSILENANLHAQLVRGVLKDVANGINDFFCESLDRDRYELLELGDRFEVLSSDSALVTVQLASVRLEVEFLSGTVRRLQMSRGFDVFTDHWAAIVCTLDIVVELETRKPETVEVRHVRIGSLGPATNERREATS